MAVATSRRPHSWENVDPTTWRFHLREGATFHNGEPVDAEAVKWNIDRVRHPIGDIPLYQQWAFVKEVVVVDNLTVDIISNAPHAYFENDVSYNGCELLPPDYFEEVGQEEFNRNPVGSGPYVLAELSENDRYVFEAWDDYHSGRPEVDRVIYQVIPEPSAQVAALLAGQVDMIKGVPAPTAPRLKALMASPCSPRAAIVCITTMPAWTPKAAPSPRPSPITSRPR